MGKCPKTERVFGIVKRAPVPNTRSVFCYTLDMDTFPSYISRKASLFAFIKIFFPVLFSIFLFSLTAHAAISTAPVQQANATWSTGTSYPVVMSSTPASGDVLVLLAACSDLTNGVVTGITQTGVTWHKAVGSNVNQAVDIWYGEVGSGATSTVTVNLAGAPSVFSRASVSEWSGVALSSELDVLGTASSSGINSTLSTASVTPAAGNNSLLLAVVRKSGTFQSGPTNGFSALSTVNTGWQFAYLVATSTAGSYSTTWTYSTSGGYDAEIATFIAATSSTNPSISSFTASSTVIAPTGTSTLSWNVSNASSVAVTPGSFSTSSGASSLIVNPTSTTLYTLTATNSNGTSTATTTITVDATSPTVPASIIATGFSSTQINLSWASSTDTGGAGLLGYTIFRCEGSSCTPNVSIATSSGTSFSDTGLAPLTTYTYAVSAFDGVGNSSAISASASASTSASTINVETMFNGDSGEPGINCSGLCQYKDHPDLGGAVGPNYVVDFTGQNFIVHDKITGAIVQSSTQSQFWTNAGVSPGSINDPRMTYDSLIGRWYAVESGPGTFFAVSANSNPTGAWKAVTLDANTGDLLMRVGFDGNGVYICTYGASIDSNCFAIPQADVQWSGSSTISLVHMGTFLNLPFEMMPGIDLDSKKASSSPEILVARQGTQNATAIPLNLIFNKITWSGTVASIDASNTVATSFTYTTPGNGTQLGNSVAIKGLESHRVFSVSEFGGNVFIVHNSLIGSHDGVQWFEVRASDETLLQSGTITDPNADFIFPTLDVDAMGNLGISYTKVDASEYPSIYVSSRLLADASGTLSNPILVSSGTASYTCGTTNPVGWGTYTTSQQDPSDPYTIWSYQEYGNSATACQWGTRWISFSLVHPVIISFAAASSSINVGSSTKLLWSIDAGGSASIDHGIGIVTGTSTTVAPSITTTYLLTAKNNIGISTSTVTIIVTAISSSSAIAPSVVVGVAGGYAPSTFSPSSPSAVSSSSNFGSTNSISSSSRVLISLFSQVRALIVELFSAENNGRPLMFGSHGADVWALQSFLWIDGIRGAADRLVPNSYFGPVTQKALVEYQSAMGIIPAVGYFGPITRKIMISSL